MVHTYSSVVSTGTHLLFLSAAGPPRTSSSQPVVIIEAGLGKVPAGHGYGGVLVRELPATHWSEKAKGLARVDCAIERTPLPPDWTSFAWRGNVSGSLSAGGDSTAEWVSNWE